MKTLFKSILLFAGITLLLAGCAKKDLTGTAVGEGEQKVTFSVMAENAGTRAVADNDGNAGKINHWIMEVRDSDGAVYNRQEHDAEEGLKTHTFDVILIKGQVYDVLFWADTKGTYNVDDLTNVKLLDSEAEGYTANLDSRDAFSAVEAGFTTTTATSKNIILKRPFAQLNVIFTDLNKLYTTIGNETEYAKFKPENFLAKAKLPTNFNVQTQTAGTPVTTALNITATGDYKDNYDTHAAEATLFMDYFFATADTKDIVDIDFSFVSKGVTISHNFTSIPFQRNYRTNVKGDLMTSDAKFNVTVDPIWDGTYTDFESTTVSTLAEANEALAKANADSYALGYFAVTITGDIDASAGAKLYLPKTEAYYKDKLVVLNFLGKITGDLEVAYAEDATSDDEKPTQLEIYASTADNLFGNLDKTTVTLKNGIFGTTTWKTAPGTLNIESPVKIGKLEVAQGNAIIAGTITEELKVAENATADGEASSASNRVEIKVINQAEVKKLVVESPAIINVTEAKEHSIENVEVNHSKDAAKTVYTDNKEEGEKSLIPEEPKSKSGEEGNWGNKTGVAVIGNTDYETVAAAVAAAQAGDVINVLASSIEMPAINKADIIFQGKGTTKVTSAGSLPTSAKNVVFDGFNFDCQIGYSGENLTFKNCLFTGTNALRYCYCNGENVLIENCEFNTSKYAIHFDAGTAALTVRNCKLRGFTTLGSSLASATFNNCEFLESEINSIYAVQSWGNIVFNDCSFSKTWCVVNDNQTIGIANGTGVAELNDCTVATGTVIAACKNSATTGLVAVDAEKDDNGKYTAGTFFGDVKRVEDNLADWHILKDNGDDTYTVEAKAIPQPKEGVFSAANDAELADVVAAINTVEEYWGKPYTIQLGAGTFGSNLTIKQFPKWNGVRGNSTDGNNMQSPQGESKTIITLKGAENFATKWEGQINVVGFGYSQGGDHKFATDVVSTTIDGIAFDNTTTVNKPTYVVTATAASYNVILKNCSFTNCNYCALYGNANDYTFNSHIEDCVYTNSEVVCQGYAKGELGTVLKGLKATGLSKGFFNAQGVTNGIVEDCDIDFSETGQYGVRTGDAGTTLLLKDCKFSSLPSDKPFSHIKKNNSTVTLENVDLSECSNRLKFESNVANSKVVLKGTTAPEEFVNDGGVAANVEDLRVIEPGEYTVSNVDNFNKFLNKFNSASANGEYTLKLANGTYNISNVILVGQEGKRLKVCAAEKGKAVLVPASGSNTRAMFIICANSNYNLESYEFDGINIDMSDTPTPAQVDLSSKQSGLKAGADLFAFYLAGAQSGSLDPILEVVKPGLYDKTNNPRYVHNLIIKNCDIKGNGISTQVVYGNTGTSGITIEDCTASNFGYFANGYFTDNSEKGWTGLKVKGGTFTSEKVFINRQNGPHTLELDGCTVTAKHDYVLRFDGGKLTVKDCQFTSQYAGDATDAGVIVTRKNATTLTVTGCTFNKVSTSSTKDIYCIGGGIELNKTITIDAGNGYNFQ